MFVETSIELLGIKILEPVTSLTDLITASVCYYAAYQLHLLGKLSRPLQLLKYYFLLLGTATTFAGLIGHAFLYAFSFNWKMIGWTFSALAIFCIENSALQLFQKYFGKEKYNWMRWLFIFQIVLFFAIILNPSTRSFNAVKANSSFGLVAIVLPIHGYLYKQFEINGYRLIAIAVILGLFPAIIFNTEFTLHDYCNFHDMSHILMAICMFILYKGAYDLALREKKIL